MKKILITLLVSLVLCIAIPSAAQATDYMTVYVGTFTPGGDYGSAAEDGGDFGLAYYGGNSGLGYAIGLHGYDTTFLGGIDISVVGVEALLTFQPEPSTIQPYLGIGIGSYAITWEVGPSSDSGSGSGGIVEAGVRMFIDDSMFFGVMVKAFSNEYEDPNNPSVNFDFGGTSSNVVLGFSF